MKADASRLSHLFEGISTAADLGRHADALRLADTARRFAPENPTARLIFARSLVQAGQPQAALECLRSHEDPDSLILRAEAAYAAGRAEDAVEMCRDLLARFAVDSVPTLAALAGRLCRASGGRLPGWVGVDSKLCLVGELTGPKAASVDWGNGSLGGIAVDGERAPGFSVEIPDVDTGVIRLRAGDRELLGSGCRWPLDYRASGWVVLEHRRLVGELSCPWDIASPRMLIVAPGRGETRHRIEPVPQEQAWPFSVVLDDLDLDRDELEVVLVLPDGRRQPLVGSPLKLPAVVPRPIVPLPPYVTVPTPGRKSPARVHIVIPVYAGVNETLTCLRSVLATAPTGALVTVIDDASPEVELRDALDTLARRGRFALIRNEVNLGFPGAANRGIELHPDRDVVLLNADTEVFAGWVERLAAVAYGSENVGTVTPLGQAASIVSYDSGSPVTLSSADAARIDRIARRVNGERGIDLPVGVGFCLYLRRSCLNEVGLFDERGFARGYGEENDLCLRARRRGWRHVAAPGVFVRHVGGRSYGRDRALLMRRNERVINHRHPGYDALIAKFVTADPLREAKRAIDAEWLIEAAVRPILLVSLELAGGVKRHVTEQRAALEALGHTVLLLRPDTNGDLKKNHAVRLEALEFRHLRYELPDELEELARILAELRLERIDIHHFLGMPPSILDLLIDLQVPYRAVIHDYTWVCPRVSLLNGAGTYCGEPELEVCDACVRDNGSALADDVTVAALRARSAAILTQAERVIVPTDDVRRRMRRYVEDLEMVVEPWEPLPAPRRRPAQSAPRDAAARTRVVLFGAIGTQKGYSILLDCARDAVHRDLPLEFVIIGHSSNDPPLWDTGRVFMTGPYAERDMSALLDRERGDVAWFPTVGPETWCYTLTYALAERLPIVAFDLGAVAERLREAETGVLLPLDTPVEAINDALLRAAAENEKLRSDDTSMAPTSVSETQDLSAELSATVQVLTLPVGLYAFTVQSGAATASSALRLPALQVAPAPVRSAGVAEFLCGPATLDRWLTASGDVVTVKVTGGDATLLLTSLRSPQSGVLSVDVRRLDAPAEAASAPAQPTEETRVITLVHVPYLGDLTFVEGWAGKPSENLWIEGFSVMVEEPQLPELVEYCGVSEDGDVTEWLSGGEFCGARGTGVPLVAFALRVRPEASRQYSCRYRGRFLSGTVIGPFDDGRFCRSEAPGDPLVAMELAIEPGPGAALRS